MFVVMVMMMMPFSVIESADFGRNGEASRAISGGHAVLSAFHCLIRHETNFRISILPFPVP